MTGSSTKTRFCCYWPSVYMWIVCCATVCSGVLHYLFHCFVHSSSHSSSRYYYLVPVKIILHASQYGLVCLMHIFSENGLFSRISMLQLLYIV